MKYTRLELHSELSKNTVKNIIVFFTIIPVVSILIGKIITGIIVVPYIGKAIQPVQYAANIENASAASAADAQYYLLQAGVFTNKENADILQKGIDNINKSVFIVNNDDLFRVIIDVSKSRNELEKIQNDLKKSGYNCIINNFDFNSKNIDAALSENIQAAIVLFELEYNAIINIESNKEVSTEEIKKQKSKVANIYEKLKSENNNSNHADQIAGNYDIIIKKTDEFIKNYEMKKSITMKSCLSDQILVFKYIYEKYTENK